MSTNKNDYYHLGLTDDEVLQSREKNGINLLTPPKRPSLWKLYLEKFEDPVVRVLLYTNFKTKDILKFDASATTEEYQLYVSILLSSSHPRKEKLIAAFYELVKNEFYPVE